jgi:hypothetical protein
MVSVLEVLRLFLDLAKSFTVRTARTATSREVMPRIAVNFMIMLLFCLWMMMSMGDDGSNYNMSMSHCNVVTGKPVP